MPASRSDRVVVCIIAALFAIPALILALGEKPNRFGFQMYSGYGQATATWTDSAGTVRDIALDDYLASPRVDIDWTANLPELLCLRIPDAVRVEVERSVVGKNERRSISC